MQQPAVTHANQAYYAQASALLLIATDLYHWLDSLPIHRRAEVLKGGFSACEQSDFLRHCLECRGHRLPDFMVRQLLLPEFSQWVASGANEHFSRPKRAAASTQRSADYSASLTLRHAETVL